MAKHPIVHLELSAKEPKAAGEFYERLFGWKIETDEKLGYTQFSPEDEGGVGGGFNPIDDNTPAGSVVAYVGTDDIAASLKKAESLGGKALMPKTEIPGVGWFGMFMDPSGNRVGLYTTANPQ
ncbi:MAG TPA: VOC family protein [Anaerolineales bacterium]|nr:VOC family protein [Anaerolineales bacterium]